MYVYVPEDEHLYTASQLRPTPADERHPNQLSESVAGALFDPDYANLPGACAGSDWELGVCSVKLKACLESHYPITLFHLRSGGLFYFQGSRIKIADRPRVINERLTVSHNEQQLPFYLRRCMLRVRS